MSEHQSDEHNAGTGHGEADIASSQALFGQVFPEGQEWADVAARASIEGRDQAVRPDGPRLKVYFPSGAL